MVSQGNPDREVIQLLRDALARGEANHKETAGEIRELRKSVDLRIDQIEAKVDQHGKVIHTAVTVGKYALPSGGLAAVIAWLLTITNGQAK